VTVAIVTPGTPPTTPLTLKNPRKSVMRADDEKPEEQRVVMVLPASFSPVIHVKTD
jgi:hypothetical protein